MPLPLIAAMTTSITRRTIIDGPPPLEPVVTTSTRPPTAPVGAGVCVPGSTVGDGVGEFVTTGVGEFVTTGVGEFVTTGVGEFVTTGVGEFVTTGVGEGVGEGEGVGVTHSLVTV